MKNSQTLLLAALVVLLTYIKLPAQSSSIDLVREIAEVMSQGPSGKAHLRFVHAKWIVCTGTFTASPGAVAISRASHFAGATVPVTIRFSDGAPDITVSDTSGDASPRGMAIRIGAGRGTDILAISHNVRQ